MARFETNVKLTATTHFHVDEDEMRALHELSTYGGARVLRALETMDGATYVRDYGEGLTAFLATIHQRGGHVLGTVDKARRLIADAEREAE